jgi:hypothetical protein
MNPRLEKVDNKDQDESDNGSSKDYGNAIESSPANTKYGKNDGNTSGPERWIL